VAGGDGGQTVATTRDATADARREPDAALGHDATVTMDAPKDANGGLDHGSPPDAVADVAPPPPLWTQEVSNLFATDLYAIWGTGPTDVYAAGENGSIVHSVGGGVWTVDAQLPTVGVFVGIWGTSPTNVYAITDVGYVCQSSGDAHWSCATIAEDLTAIWGPSAEYCYLVSDVGVITRLVEPGQLVTTELNGHSAYGFWGVWGSGPGDVYVAGDNGEVLHSDGDAGWTPEIAGQPGTGGTLWGSGPTDIYEVGGTVPFHSSGGGKWAAETTPTTTTALFGVWGSSASDVYITGDVGTVLHRVDGGAWTAEATASTVPLNAVWGSGPTDVYAVGGSATILHRTGLGM